ncbi:hypothetical protein GCM10010294_68030 [Streptomyces griseoloalbus]|uniref:hypothetical protein n=1 Tax=Streptomyces griseoloalbus TaxID=67303 RepID=UPI001874CA40|nr:hypothetical protein GCM10010294_68030 [Streptomyces griseoloalbus]
MTAPRSTPTAGGVATPARPVRFADPKRNAAYWARIERNTAAAPPLTTEQIATLRGIFAPVVASMAKEAA